LKTPFWAVAVAASLALALFCVDLWIWQRAPLTSASDAAAGSAPIAAASATAARAPQGASLEQSRDLIVGGGLHDE
jgi:hypothetical protein